MLKKLIAKWLAIEEWYDASDLFKMPKMHVYFGTHSGHTWLTSKLNNTRFKWLSKFFSGDPVCCTSFRLTKYLFHNKQVFGVTKGGKYERHWVPDFEQRLKKLHIDKVLPFTINLPSFMDFCAVRNSVYCKSKYEHYSYEAAPYVKLVLFGIDLCIYWTAPNSDSVSSTETNAYWETMFEYLDEKALGKLNGMTTAEKAEYMAKKCSFWQTSYVTGEKNKVTFCMDSSFVADQVASGVVAKVNQVMYDESVERHNKLRCPYCGYRLTLNRDEPEVTIPRKYEYQCLRCRSVVYLNDKIE